MGWFPAVPTAVLFEGPLPGLNVSAVCVSSSQSCWSMVGPLGLWHNQITDQRTHGAVGSRLVKQTALEKEPDASRWANV